MKESGKKNRILVLSHISELVGGAEKSLLDVFDSWAEDYPIEPIFILKEPVGTMKVAIEKRGWKYYGVEYTFWSEGEPPKTSEKKYVAALKNTRAIQKIEDIIQQEQPDLVLTNSVVCPWAAIAAHYQKIPHVWFVREYGDLDHGRIFEIGRKKTLQDVGNLSELVVANSKTLENHLEKYIDKQKLTTLYTPFNIKKLLEKSDEKVKSPFSYSNSLKVVVTGSLTPSKGQLDAIKAIGRLNVAGYLAEICIIGGNGPKDYKKRIRKTIKKYKISDKVKLVGHQANPLALISLADVGIMSSRMEAFGRVTFEYMAVGLAMIGTDSGATPEMIEDGKNGYLYKPGDIETLVHKLKIYIEDPNLISKHGQNSKRKAEEMMQGKYKSEDVYQKILGLLSDDGQKQKTQPINYTHKWLEYPQLANDFIIETGKISVKKLIFKRARTRLGSVRRKTRQTAKKAIKG